MQASYYLKIAWRNLKNNRFYSTLNILGLAMGLATSIMLLIWVRYAFSFDKFNTHYKQVYQLNSTIKTQDGKTTWAQAPGGIATLVMNVPGVLKAVRLKEWNDQNISNEERTKVFDGNAIAYVDSNFLKVFDYKLLRGNHKDFLKNVNSVAITKELAEKLYNSDDVIGKKIHYYGSIFEITALLKDFPNNSSLQYTALFPMSAYAHRLSTTEGKSLNFINEEMGSFGFRIFLLLDPMASPGIISNTITKKFKQVSKNTFDFQLQNLSSIHLTTPDGNTSDLRIIQIFLLVAILILIVASINYINLSTARSLMRLKEVSVRKIIGARKMQLFLQFLSEAVLLFTFASVLASALTFVLMPFLKRFSGDDLHFNLLDSNTLYIFIGVTSGTLITATLYPAFLLASFNPIKTIKGVASGFKIVFLRKVLVVVQFSISFILLISAITMSRQMQFIQDKHLGFDKSYVFSAPMTNNMVGRISALESELKQIAAVESVGVSDAYDFSSVENLTNNIEWKGKPDDDKTLFTGLSADKGFVNAMKFHFVEGGNFTGSGADSNKFILNKTAITLMGLKKPWLGTKITYNNISGEIIGVVKDFNYQPLTKAIGPLIIDNRGFKNILYVRTTAANAPQAIEATERLYKKYSGNAPFSYYFLDSTFENKYRSQQNSTLLFRIFSGITLFISSLGLLGLATYSAAVKTKEIGVRKVMGASVGSIIQLIAKDFLKLVLLAIILGVPIAYLGMSKWMDHFAYRIGIGNWTFLIGAFVVVLIALITIGTITFKAARANPVESLRSE